MKIAILAPTGKIEVDDLNALIELVRRGVVEKTTIVEAKGRRVPAADIHELKPVFEKLETEKQTKKENSTPKNEISESLKSCQTIKLETRKTPKNR